MSELICMGRVFPMDNERLEAKGLGPSVGREGQARKSGEKAGREDQA